MMASSADCVHQGDSTHFHSVPGICWSQPFHSLITIHFMDFNGYNMCDDAHNIFDVCMYGGLFILEAAYNHSPGSGKYRAKKICLNITSEMTFPYHVVSHFKQMLVVFQTFAGYTEGHVTITMSHDTDCIGTNFLTHINCISNFNNVWASTKDTSHNKPQNKTCTDYWVVHYAVADAFLPSELERCTFAMSSEVLAHNVDSGHIVVSGAVVHHHLTSSGYFTITIESYALRHFPVDLSTEKSLVSLRIPTTSRQTFKSNAYKSLSFKLNYTGDFPELVLAIRIQNIENVICTPMKGHHPLDFAPIYVLNSTLSDAYLSRLHPYRGYVVKFMNYTGYNRGSC